MPSAHARIGPSSLSRVIRCPGSVRETEGMPRNSSVFAAEGTLLHEIAEECLDFGLEPDHFFGQVRQVDGFTFVVGTKPGETDPGCIQLALDWLRDQPGELFIETKVSLDRWMPGQFGTCDIGIWDAASETCTIFDWKFGMGVMVETVGNEQLRAYALGFYDTTLAPRGIKPARFRIIIEQPRGSGGQRFYEPWEISYDELLSFGDVLEQTWEAVNDPNAPLCAGEKQCFFCDAKNRPPQPGNLTGCGTYDEFVMQVIDSRFDDIDEAIAFDLEPKLPRNPTPERRSWIVRHAKMFEKWLARLHEDSLFAAEYGTPDPGMKLVAGRRGAREWSEDDIDQLLIQDRLIQSLSDNAFTRKLKSPAQAEKDLATKRGRKAHPGDWEWLSALIVQGEGKPVLVSESDPRPAIEPVDNLLDDD